MPIIFVSDCFQEINIIDEVVRRVHGRNVVDYGHSTTVM